MNPKPSLIAVGETGEVYSPEGRRLVPDKQPGVHRWGAIAAHYLSAEQAEAAFEPGNEVRGDASNLISFGVVCLDCEQPYARTRKTCYAPPSQWWNP